MGKVEAVTVNKPMKDGSFWGICLGHTFTHWYSASFYILLPYMTLELGLSAAQAGSLVTAMFLFKTATGIPIGAITDMMRRKNLILALSLILAGIPFFFMGLTDAYLILMMLVIIMGIGNEMWHPASFAILAARFPEQRGFVFGFHGMAANLGDLLAPVVIGGLIAMMAWQDVVYWNVLPGLIVSVIILWLLRHVDFGHKQTGQEGNMNFSEYVNGFKELLKNKIVLLLALASGFRSMAQTGLMTFLPLYLAIEMGISPLWVGIYVSILQGGGLLSAPIVGAISDKHGERKVVYSGMVLTSVMVLVMTLVRVNLLMIVTVALIGFFLYALRPVMHAWAMNTTSDDMAGTTTSLVFTTQSLMATVAPFIGGLLADQFGYISTFYFIAAVILIGNLVVFLIPKQDHELAK